MRVLFHILLLVSGATYVDVAFLVGHLITNNIIGKQLFKSFGTNLKICFSRIEYGDSTVTFIYPFFYYSTCDITMTITIMFVELFRELL